MGSYYLTWGGLTAEKSITKVYSVRIRQELCLTWMFGMGIKLATTLFVVTLATVQKMHTWSVRTGQELC